MRILHVINTLDPSGAERHLANLFGPLASMGVENHLVTYGAGNGFADQVRDHVHNARINVGWRNALPVTVAMAREVDVVHTQLAYADVIGRAAAVVARRPAVTTLQASIWGAESWGAFAPRERAKLAMLWPLDALTARTARRLFAVSTRTGESYVRGLGVSPARVEVLANSVDLRQFGPTRGPDRDEARRAMGYAPDEFAVLSLSRLSPQKGLPDAVRAIAEAGRHRKVRLQIAGEGAERARVQAVIDETGAPASLLGRRDALTAYRAADLFLLTSYYEGMPLALIEAMAMGLPCLCTNIAENAETGADAVAYAKPHDPQGVAEAIIALCDDPARRQELSLRALERAKVYSADAVARRFLDGIRGSIGA